MTYYVPIILDLRDRCCVLVGGGAVAERRVASLLPSGARIKVISPRLTPWLIQTWEQGQINWTRRCYQKGDLQGAWIVYAVTDQPEVNDEVAAEARELGVMVNQASEGRLSSFITPSSFRRGELIVAVSTSGAAPGAAKQICDEIATRFGDEYEEYIHFLSQARSVIKDQVQDASRRRRLFKKLLEIDILRAIQAGKFSPPDGEEMICWIDQYQEG
ncbi:precorrin-2 dehydrogenase/sirohydrochlorin ferrochelatase family protein [Paenibacillus aceti]|uniref:precorrin-2 dehydrogenase n=1 Tax=Paenibacillus aceti TaxID=1820010 RepID=A0ABQ1VQM6_9BACL|nr:bifunctional precorrin-2 dehydrogenase/sirohydrochlorin ferrochelatase [Paenibacillus aceti]GGF89317.1 precorrin-2 dehydrogenase [Paenibacillus aceti]